MEARQPGGSRSEAAQRRIAVGPGGYVRFTRKYPLLVIAAALFIVFALLVSIFADGIAPYHYTAQDLLNRLKPPAFLGGGLLNISSAPTSSGATC